MSWSSVSPNGNFSQSNVTSNQLWLPAHHDYSHINVEKRTEMVKTVSDLIHFRLDHLFGEQLDQNNGGQQDSAQRINTKDINYLFHYIDDSIVVLERYFDRYSTVYNELVRSRYVLFANFGTETVVKDFADKFHYSLTQLATNMNRTSQFLIMRTLKLDSGEAIIVTVQ